MGLPWGIDRPRGQGHNPLGSCPALVHVHSTVTVIGHFRIAFPKAQLEGTQTGCSIHQKGSLRAPGRLIPPHCKPRTSKARWDCSELWVISGFVLYHALLHKKFLSPLDSCPCWKKPRTALRLPAAQHHGDLSHLHQCCLVPKGPASHARQGRAPATRTFLQLDTKFISAVCKIHLCACTPC